MTDEVELYDSNNVDSLAWPDTEDCRHAKKLLVPLLKKGVSKFIDNINAETYALKAGEFVFPVLATTENYTNSWVCSPYAHYISYGKESVGIVGNVFLSKIIMYLIEGLGKLSRLGKMNSVVYVNNWMYSTDLYPDALRPELIKSIVQLLKKRFPRHAIIFRSLNGLTTPQWMDTLPKQGFQLIASRYVFVTDGKNESIYKTRILKSDLKLFKEHPYQLVDETDLHVDECQHLKNLYHQLYVIQHSHLQPQFNQNYFRLLFETRLLRFKVLKSDGVIKGVAGYYHRNNVMVCSIFGYEKNSSESNVIYRLLNTALLLEARKNGLLFNQSAGAAFFKSVRRAEGCLEYMAIYNKHLPAYRQIFWSTLKLFINKVGSKYMEKY
jgi:hypothetical protein